jgi:hypothetical protein
MRLWPGVGIDANCSCLDFGGGSSLCTLLIMSDDFDLHPHSGKSKLVYTETGRGRLVVRRPLLQISNGRHEGWFAEFGEVDPDLVNLRPALSASMLQGVIDVGEGLINLFIKVCGYFAGFRVPATFKNAVSH